MNLPVINVYTILNHFSNLQNEKSDQVKAAEMKMFGKLTREEFEWHPDKLLCRRFNVPNPYPGLDNFLCYKYPK